MAKTICECEVRQIGIVISHPFGLDNGGIKTTLNEWMEVGPGPRKNVRPIKVFCMTCGADLDLKIIPIQYRNDMESNRLINEGMIRDPWARI